MWARLEDISLAASGLGMMENCYMRESNIGYVGETSEWSQETWKFLAWQVSYMWPWESHFTLIILYITMTKLDHTNNSLYSFSPPVWGRAGQLLKYTTPKLGDLTQWKLSSHSNKYSNVGSASGISSLSSSLGTQAPWLFISCNSAVT